MSRRVTISVPDDVAEQLDQLPARQVSAYVTEALRRRRVSDDMRTALRTAGHPEFPYDPIRAAQRLATRQVTPEAREAAIARIAQLLGRPADELRSELDRRSAA
ncbi:hypothetical protein ONA70_09955 [Micromonospora yasonensis]|uniref:hypothetical protein n=1 Tax=Micromonospora yasonensis TaxID=1128667 RepID=UPI0022305522|nr:hypothetical protein [Micromonospora yasonensis]MCW3840417.1 hypothetical protein [Micromonospora yasonensis]